MSKRTIFSYLASVFILIGISFYQPIIANALSVFATVQGGTGTTTPSGILTGDNGATTHVNTLNIGSNLTYNSGTNTLSATGGSGTPGGTSGQLQYNGASTFQGVSTTTVTCSGNTSCTQFVAIGPSPITISSTGGGSGLSTTSPLSGGNLLAYTTTGAGAAYGVGTSTATIGNGLSSSVGTTLTVVGGSDTTLTATLGTTITPNELSAALAANSIPYSNSAGTAFASAATSSLTIGTGLSSTGTAGALVGGTALNVSFNNVLASGGTATTTFYNKGVVFSDGSKLTQATGSGASILNWDNPNGRLGIGTTTPMSSLSVLGNEDHWGTYYHYGNSPVTDSLFCTTSSKCFAHYDTDNTLSGVAIENGNISSGASAYSVYTLQNDLTDNTGTHYNAWSQNSSGYNDNTFGTAFNEANLMELVNTDGGLGISINANNAVAARSHLDVFFGTTAPSTPNVRILPTAFGIGTSTPHATLAVNANNTSPTKNLLELSYSGGATNNSTTTVLTVATSSTSQLAIGTTSPLSTNVLTTNGGVYLHGIATGAGNGAVCMATDGQLLYDAGANCIVSSLRFKNVDATITPEESLSTVMQLSPIFFHYKDGYGDNGAAKQEGFGAEDVALVDTSLVQYDAQGNPFSVFYQNLTAKLTGAIQAMEKQIMNILTRQDAQQKEIDDLKAQVKALQDAQQKPLPKKI